MLFEHKNLKKLSLLGVAALCVAAGSTMQAAEITVAGGTLGSLNGGATGCSAAFQGLAFACNSAFSVTTVGGFAALGGTGASGADNLGSLTLAASTFNYSAVPFSLQVNFTAPAGITAGNPATFVATVSGAVNTLGNGGVFIDFNNTPQTFTFSSGNTTGSFSLAVNDTSINPGQTVTITGNVFGASATSQTPEPASMALMGLGLVAVGFASRKISAARR